MKKRILKRIGCSLVILSSLLLGTACNCSAYDTTQDVLFYKSTTHVGMSGEYSFFDSPVLFDFENSKYRFESDSLGTLHLKSADGIIDYLSFPPYKEFNTEDRMYSVKKIYTSNPNLQFLEISVRNVVETLGYWLIGKDNNKWITYVSYDSLKSVGLSDGGMVISYVNPDCTGKMTLELTSSDSNERVVLRWNDTAKQMEILTGWGI